MYEQFSRAGIGFGNAFADLASLMVDGHCACPVAFVRFYGQMSSHVDL